MKILILYLTGQRDKVVDNLIANHLRALGHEVHVHPYMDAGRESVPYLKPDVVVHPFPGGQYKVDFLKKCKEWGCLVVIRRGEAGASRTVFEKLTPSQQTLMMGNWDYGGYVDLELCWGTEFMGIIAEKGHVPIRNLRACGAFAFDTYFRNNSRSRNRKKMVLFATGFSAADSRVEYCECGLPRDAEYHKNLYNLHVRNRVIWLDAIRCLHEEFNSTWDFSLKVRPGERTNEYIEKLGDIVKVYPQNYPASDALRESDMLIHTGSTMAMEAHLLNMPAFNFGNLNPDRVLANLSPLAIYEDLRKAFQEVDVDRSNVNWPVFYELQNHLYGEIDGAACDRAALFIHNLIVTRQVEHQTNIPDTWPKEVMYLAPGVMTEDPKKKGLPGWTCPACKGHWWTERKILMADCPWCGMTCERTTPNKKFKPKTVLTQAEKSVLA